MITNVLQFADIRLSSLHLGMLRCPATVPCSVPAFAQLAVDGSAGGDTYVSITDARSCLLVTRFPLVICPCDLPFHQSVPVQTACALGR